MKLRYIALLAGTTMLVGLDVSISQAQAAGSRDKVRIPYACDFLKYPGRPILDEELRKCLTHLFLMGAQGRGSS